MKTATQVQHENHKTGVLQGYYFACDHVLIEFIKRYFLEDDTVLSDVYEGPGNNWVARDIGTVACIGDYYIDMHDMVTCLENNVPSEVFFKWYTYSLDEHMQERSPVNLENFWRQYKEVLHSNPPINGQTISIELTQEQIEQLTKKKPVKKWEDLTDIAGFFVHPTGYVHQFDLREKTSWTYVAPTKAIYATENQARSALAMAMLSQLMKDVNGEWKPTWNSTYQKKYIIEFTNFKINTNYYYEFPCFLSFPTKEIRDEFLANHRELIEEYFLLYK